jgi:chromosome segregation ATPase
MKIQCTAEFLPLFTELNERHNDAIECLREANAQELQEIELNATKEIEKFAPRSFISRQEIRLREGYEMALQRHKEEYEKKRDALNEQIQAVETERDCEIQKIGDDMNQQMDDGEQRVKARIQRIRDSVIEPDLPQIPDRVQLAPEQENEMRQKIDFALKESFEESVKNAVAEVARRREIMEKKMAMRSIQELANAERQLANEIESVTNEIAGLRQEIQSGVSEIDSLKADWTESNHRRRDQEDMLAKLQNACNRAKTRLTELESIFTQLSNEEGNEEDDREADEIQGDLQKLGKEVMKEKRSHANSIKRKAAAHEESMGQIKERVRALTQGKDELITRLKTEIRAVKEKGKVVEHEIRRKLTAYEKGAST